MNAYETEELIMEQSSFEDFKDRLLESLKIYFEEDAKITFHEVIKPGVQSLTGLCIHRPGYNTCPTLYVEQYYLMLQNGRSFESIVQEMIGIFDQYGPLQLSMEYFGEYLKVRDRIYYRLIGKEGNEDFLKITPHINYLNLAVIFYYEMPTEILDGGKINIKQQMLKTWGITTEELLADAVENWKNHKKMELQSMWYFFETYLKEKIRQAADSSADRELLMKELGVEGTLPIDSEQWQEEILQIILKKNDFLDADRDMFILRTEEQTFGANYLYDVEALERITQRVSKHFYILPSSIHELILIPDSGIVMSVDELKALVTEVNHNVVAAEEVLTDGVYYYDGEKKEVTLL